MARGVTRVICRLVATAFLVLAFVLPVSVRRVFLGG